MLSTFEHALLERHLRSCASCRRFAADVTEHTARVRATPLVAAPQFSTQAPARVRPLRHRAAGIAGAVAVAAGLAAALVLVPPAGNRQSATAVRLPTRALLGVVSAAPTPNATFDVPRLKVVSAARADGAVRGYYGIPVD